MDWLVSLEHCRTVVRPVVGSQDYFEVGSQDYFEVGNQDYFEEDSRPK